MWFLDLRTARVVWFFPNDAGGLGIDKRRGWSGFFGRPGRWRARACGRPCILGVSGLPPCCAGPPACGRIGFMIAPGSRSSCLYPDYPMFDGRFDYPLVCCLVAFGALRSYARVAWPPRDAVLPAGFAASFRVPRGLPSDAGDVPIGVPADVYGDAGMPPVAPASADGHGTGDDGMVRMTVRGLVLALRSDAALRARLDGYAAHALPGAFGRAYAATAPYPALRSALLGQTAGIVGYIDDCITPVKVTPIVGCLESLVQCVSDMASSSYAPALLTDGFMDGVTPMDVLYVDDVETVNRCWSVHASDEMRRSDVMWRMTWGGETGLQTGRPDDPHPTGLLLGNPILSSTLESRMRAVVLGGAAWMDVWPLRSFAARRASTYRLHPHSVATAAEHHTPDGASGAHGDAEGVPSSWMQSEEASLLTDIIRIAADGCEPPLAPAVERSGMGLTGDRGAGVERSDGLWPGAHGPRYGDDEKRLAIGTMAKARKALSKEPPLGSGWYSGMAARGAEIRCTSRNTAIVNAVMPDGWENVPDIMNAPPMTMRRRGAVSTLSMQSWTTCVNALGRGIDIRWWLDAAESLRVSTPFEIFLEDLIDLRVPIR